jgi:hypothetical protein
LVGVHLTDNNLFPQLRYAVQYQPMVGQQPCRLKTKLKSKREALQTGIGCELGEQLGSNKQTLSRLSQHKASFRKCFPAVSLAIYNLNWTLIFPAFYFHLPVKSLFGRTCITPFCQEPASGNRTRLSTAGSSSPVCQSAWISSAFQVIDPLIGPRYLSSWPSK